MKVSIKVSTIAISKDKYGRFSIWTTPNSFGRAIVKVTRTILRPFGYEVLLRGRRWKKGLNHPLYAPSIPLKDAQYHAMYFNKKKARRRYVPASISSLIEERR